MERKKEKKQVGIWFDYESYEVVRKLAFDLRLSVAGYLRSLAEKEIKKAKKKEE